MVVALQLTGNLAGVEDLLNLFEEISARITVLHWCNGVGGDHTECDDQSRRC